MISPSMKVSGFTLFGMAMNIQSSHNFELLDNTFLYSCSSRFAVSLAPQKCNSLTFADNSVVARNVFRYSEMSALKLQGKNQVFEDNLMEWNGYSGLDGPGTVTFQGNEGPVVKYNTLRYNNQVTGIFVAAIDSEVSENWVDHQNWGGLQHDGAGIHVTIDGQTSYFERNWISNGHHSMMIRFDTAKKTLLKDVGTDGKVYNNVAWGGPDLVVKGDEHILTDNTVIGTVEVVRDWGAACGQNVYTRVEKNIAREFKFRGSCKLNGKDISGKPSAPEGSFKDNEPVPDPCSELRDCDAMDFRPRKFK